VSARVRRIAAGEADLLRELRLRSLREDPLAFGSTYEREAAPGARDWQRWAAEGATGERQAFYIVEPAGGLASGAIHDPDDGLAHLYGVWVAPEARGTGAGRALVDAVVAWATASGAHRLVAAVTEGNKAAARLYAGAGFVDTGAREPLGHSGATVAILERALS
jgi:ribosomal protein S18 acetylase RimI-like enzyme